VDLTHRDTVQLKSEAAQVMRLATHAALMDVTKLNDLAVDKSESVSVAHKVTDKPMSEEDWPVRRAARIRERL